MIELEKKWNIPASAYLKKMNAEACEDEDELIAQLTCLILAMLRRRGASEASLEARTSPVQRPIAGACFEARRSAPRTSQRGMGRCPKIGDGPSPRLGVVPVAARDDRDQAHDLLRRVRPRRASANGFLTSVRLMAICVAASVAIGVVGAWVQGVAAARRCASAMQGYIQFFRNTPPLVQLYFFYFALGSYLRMTTEHRPLGAARLELRLGGDLAVVLRRRVQRRDLPRRHRGGAARDRRGRRKRSATAGSRPMSS